MQGSIKFGLVILMATAVLIVLVSPAPDELPCTVGKHPSYQAGLVSITTILPLVNLLSATAARQSNSQKRVPRVVDVLSSNCTLVC